MSNNNSFIANFNSFGSSGGGGGSSPTQVTTQFMMSGLITNFASGGTPEFIDWSGTLSPSGTHNSVLPIIQEDSKIVAIAVKYLDTTACQVSADFDYTFKIEKLTNTSGSTNSGLTTYTNGNNIISLNFANINGTFFSFFSSALSITISNGDMLAVTGNLNAGSNNGGDNEEVMVSVLFQNTYNLT